MIAKISQKVFSNHVYHFAIFTKKMIGNAKFCCSN